MTKQQLLTENALLNSKILALEKEVEMLREHRGDSAYCDLLRRLVSEFEGVVTIPQMTDEQFQLVREVWMSI